MCSPAMSFLFPVKSESISCSVMSDSGILQARILEWVQFSSVSQSCPTLCDPLDCSMLGFPVQHHSWRFHWVSDAIQSSHLLSSPLEWVALPFSRGSSQPRDQTQVSCLSGGFFTSWPTREVLFSTAYKFTASLLSHDYTFCSLEKGNVMTSFQKKPQSWPVYLHYIFKC